MPSFFNNVSKSSHCHMLEGLFPWFSPDFTAPKSSGFSKSANPSVSACAAKARNEKSANTFPQSALFLSDQVSRLKPRGKTNDLTGRGPFLFAQVARENVLHGGLSKTA